MRYNLTPHEFMLLCTQIGNIRGRHNGATKMENSTVQTFIISNEMATLIREGAAKERNATGAKKKAAEAIAEAGGRGAMFTKDGVKDGLISAETLAGIQGAIAAGLLSKAEFTLWAGGSKAAAAAGLQTERNALTSNVNKYLSHFRGMIETAWANLNPEAAALEAEAEAEEAEAEEAEAAPITGDVLRKRLLDLITDVAASDLENASFILESLNDAEALMVNW
jgi:hypothetical protein